ncbi:MAG: ParA family protein [Bacilli bacterium]
MTRVTSVLNQKGGVMKSNIIINLAYGLAKLGNGVLVIDLDQQCNTTSKYLKNEVPTNKTITDYFKGEIPNLPIYSTDYNVDLVPASLDLAVATSRVRILDIKLQKGIEAIKDNYDYILIDTNPSITELTFNCIVASDDIIIPSTIDHMSFVGFETTSSVIKDVANAYGREIPHKLLYTKVNEKMVICKTKIEENKNSGVEAFETRIRFQSKPVSECTYTEEMVLDTLTDKKIKTGVALDLENLIQEYMGA